MVKKAASTRDKSLGQTKRCSHKSRQATAAIPAQASPPNANASTSITRHASIPKCSRREIHSAPGMPKRRGMLMCLVALIRAFGLGPTAGAGIVAVAGLLLWEHRLVRADDLSRIDAAFFTMNGYVSVIFFVFWATDIFLT